MYYLHHIKRDIVFEFDCFQVSLETELFTRCHGTTLLTITSFYLVHLSLDCIAVCCVSLSLSTLYHGLGLEAPRGHFTKSLALALVLDLKSLTIGCHIITLLFVIIQWNRIRELGQKTFAFTLLLTWIKFKFYHKIIINTHCWLPVNIYVIENDIVLVRHGLDVGLDLNL